MGEWVKLVRSAMKRRALAAGLLPPRILWCGSSRGAPAATSHARDASEIERLEQRVEELYAEGQVLHAIPLAEQLLAATERRRGPEHEATALRLPIWRACTTPSRSTSKAAPLFERSIAIYERRLGARHADTATVIASLAALRRDAGATPKPKGCTALRSPFSRRRWGPTIR